MATKIIYYTDTPQDTAFTDKLYDAASERVQLAGMTEGEFEVIDILTDEEQKQTGHLYGPMRFKFQHDAKAHKCMIYPARFLDVTTAKCVCEEVGVSMSRIPWHLATE